MPSFAEQVGGTLPGWIQGSYENYLNYINDKNNRQEQPEQALSRAQFEQYKADTYKYGGFLAPAERAAIDAGSTNGILNPGVLSNVVGMADERQGSAWTNGPLQLALGVAGGALAAGYGGAGAGAADAAWGVNPTTGLDWSAIDAGNAVAPWSTNPSLADLGGLAGEGAGAGGLADLLKYPLTPAQQELLDKGGTLPSNDVGSMTQAAAPVTESGTKASMADIMRLASLGTTGASLASKLLSGSASPGDWTQALGLLGATGLGVLGANAQQNAYKDVYDQQMALGAPSRARYEASFQPGFDLYTADPGAKSAADATADSTARSLSTSFGNPFDQPSATGGIFRSVLGQNNAQLNTYRSQNLTGGQLGTNTAGTASLQGAGQSGTLYDAIGGGLGALTQPQNSLEDLIKKYRVVV